MANTSFPVGTIGANVLSTTPKDSTLNANGAKFALGARAMGNDSEWIYVKAGATPITQFDAVRITDAFVAAPITSALAQAGSGYVGFAQVAFATSDFGWVMLTGKPRVRLTTSVNPVPVPLFTTDTAGVLGITTASLSGAQILGLYNANGATSGASGGTTCMASWPIIRKPITNV
jgi:hypothetical protein